MNEDRDVAGLSEEQTRSGDDPDRDGTTGGDGGESTCLCPLGGVMDLLGRRYAIQTVCVVDELGPVRYGEIAAAFGDVSSSTLSTRLEELVDAGLLERRQYDEIPPRVEYELTADGAALATRLRPLVTWAARRDGSGP